MGFNIWHGGAVLVEKWVVVWLGQVLGLGLGEVEEKWKEKKGKKIKQKGEMFFFSFDSKIDG